jgi:hypothetical protein
MTLYETKFQETINNWQERMEFVKWIHLDQHSYQW